MQTMPLTKKRRYIFLSFGLIILAIVIYLIIKINEPIKVISGKEFEKLTNPKEIYIKDGYIYFEDENHIYKTLLSGVDIKELAKRYPIKSFPKSSKYLNYLAVILLFSILIVIILILKRDRVAPTIELSTKEDKLIENRIEPIYNTNIKFSDVAGIEDVKSDLEEIVEFLKEPWKFRALDLKMPKGVLLVGPPGVGKTLLAKAIASEAGVPFFYHSGANFVQIYAGMGAKRVKELFEKAKQMAPSIIFIDEIDAVGKSRDRLNNEEREATLNQLLVEMDGFEDSLGVVVIAATNRVDILDPALLRARRFDRRIFIELPNKKEREQIIKYYLKNKKFDLDIKEVAKITSGLSPATIEVLINEAALEAYKSRDRVVKIEHILKVKDRVVYGKKRVKLYSPKEREILANALSAKGVVATWLGFSFDKLSFVSSFTLKEELLSKNEEIRRLKVFMSSIVFIEKEFGDFFSLLLEDKKEIEKILYNLKSFSYEEIQKDFLSSQKEEVEEIVNRLKDIIKRVAKELNEKENLTFSEVKRVVDEIF